MQGGWVSFLWDKVILVIVGVFLLSIVQSTVQERLATLDQRKIQQFQREQRAKQWRKIKLIA